MNPNWKPLPSMDSQSAGNFGSSSSIFNARGPRQITKHPQSMFNNFPGNGFGGSGNGGGNGIGGGSGMMRQGGGSPGSIPQPMSPTGGNSSYGNGRFTALGGSGFGDSSPTNGSGGFPRPDGFRNGSGNGGGGGGGYGMGASAGGFGGSNGFGGSGNPPHRSNSSGNGFTEFMSNGSGSGNGRGGFSDIDRFESNRMERQSQNGYDRNMSSFDPPPHQGHPLNHQNHGSMSRNNGYGSGGGGDMGMGMSNGYDRQMSAPNLRDQQMNGMSNSRNMSSYGNSGFNDFDRSNSMFGGGNGSNGRSHSPFEMFGGGGGGGGGESGNMMKIGTWDSGNGGNRGDGGGGGAGGNSRFSNVSNFEIGTFNVPGSNNSGNEYNSNNGSYSQSGNNITGGPGIRETGIIEKLLHSYGFIQCCDRQARLFFHFSQFEGNIEHLKIGDPVEFEMTYDRRTGKPIASNVSKIAPEVVMSEERVIGTVTTGSIKDEITGNESQGRISYENRGECFFLPFTQSDVEGNVVVAPGDKCSFQMATMARSGNLVARTIRLENPAAPVKYQGVINSIKENFGFIERADVVREIFFHFTEMTANGGNAGNGGESPGRDPQLGDHVEFNIQTRNGKEVACNIVTLPEGTVVFEDVGTEFFKGQVLKPIDKSAKFNAGNTSPNGGGPANTSGGEEALNGRVKFRGVDRSEEEIQFSEKDQVGEFTLRHGDWIRFVIAIDRRDKMKHATKIELMEESFAVSDERREQGKILSRKDGFGFIRCAEREARMFFHFSEILDVKRAVVVGDEVEFTVAEDPNQPSRYLATRIKHLDTGSVVFNIVLHQGVMGVVEAEPAGAAFGKGDAEEREKTHAGKILYELGGLNLEIILYANDCDLRNCPRKSDIVRFDINQCKATKETSAVNVVVVESKHKKSEPIAAPTTAVTSTPATSGVSATTPTKKESVEIAHGYIAALKDGFGFLETQTHDKEIFFHFSNVEGKAEKLEVGMEVSYMVYNREKGGKLSAEGVKVADKGTIPALQSDSQVLKGTVVRPLRSINPDQDEYCGEIHVYSSDGKSIDRYQFSIASLANKKDLLQLNDPVQFQPCLTEPNFATLMKCTREKQRAFVEAMKGSFGFLSYEVEEGKKLFFHTCEVEENEVLQQGDEVEFVVVSNKRTGKHSAVAVRKISTCKRPDRLISKLKTMNLDDGGKKMVVIRQPRGPDAGNGFKALRNIG